MLIRVYVCVLVVTDSVEIINASELLRISQLSTLTFNITVIKSGVLLYMCICLQLI